MKFVTSFNTIIYRLNKRERLSEVEYLDLLKDNIEYLQIIKNHKKQHQ